MGNIRIVLNVIDSGAFADDVNTQVVDQGEDEDEPKTLRLHPLRQTSWLPTASKRKCLKT